MHIHIFILVQSICHNTHVDFCHTYYSVLYGPTINYILYGSTMKAIQQLLPIFASLLPLLLLVLLLRACRRKSCRLRAVMVFAVLLLQLQQ